MSLLDDICDMSSPILWDAIQNGGAREVASRLRTYPSVPAADDRVAKCDACSERPGIRTVWVSGIETFVCSHCGGDPDYPCYACGGESTHEIMHRGAPLDVCDECDQEHA